MKRHININMLSQYLDGELSAPLRQEVERHVSVCGSCAEKLESLKKGTDLLAALGESAEPENMLKKFNHRLNERLLKRGKTARLIIYAEDIIGDIRDIVTPKAPALVRAMAVVMIAMAVTLSGFYYFGRGNPTISFAKGYVSFFDPGSQKWIPAPINMRLKEGQILRAQGSSYVDITLQSKYALRLKGNSEIKIAGLTPRHRNGKAVYELSGGKFLVNIEKAFKGSEFRVITPQAELTALGTKFMVDASGDKKGKTWLGVLEGKVKAEAKDISREYAALPKEVIVKGGSKTEIMYEQPPAAPTELRDDEWNALQELYQIGRKPQVALLISDSPDRVKELLRPCAIYISDEKPRVIPTIFEDALLTIDQAIREGDRAKHIEAVKKLERIVNEYPDPRYDVQFLLFIGAYYEYLDLHKEAIETFSKIIKLYPHSSLAGLAECAQAVIYEESLKDKHKAEELYRNILIKYNNTPEAAFAKTHLTT